MRLFVFLTSLMVIAIPLVAAEIFVRVAYRYNSPDTIRRNSLQYVASVFARHRLRPDQRLLVDEAWGLKAKSERTGREYRINQLGYRGRPFSGEKKKGTARIVILGGSAVFDPGATEGRDWPHLVEEKLRDRGFGGAEVLNAGVPGHATFDSLGRLYSQIWTLQPDYVLVYNAWNDIKYFTDLSREHSLLMVVRPYDARADPFENYMNALDRFLCLSQVYVKVRNRYLIWKLKPGPEGAARQGPRRRDFNDIALRQYRLDLELLVDAAREIGAVPVLLTQGTLVTEETTDSDRAKINYEYQELDQKGLVRAFQGCNQAMQVVSQEKGVGLLDVDAIMSGNSDFFEDHVHLSRRGGEVISDLVADYLAKDLARIGSNPPGETPRDIPGERENVHER